MAKLRLRNGTVLDLELQEFEDGSVRVAVKDELCPNLITFTKNGRILRHRSVLGSTTFRVNGEGQIKLAKGGDYW